MGDVNDDLLKPNTAPGKHLLHSLEAVETVVLTKNITIEKYCAGILAVSDHVPVEAVVGVAERKTVQPIIKRSFTKLNYSTVGERIRNIVVDDTLSTSDLLDT